MSNSTCPNTAALQPTVENVRFATYYLIAPVYVLVAACCHTLFLFALYKQSRKQPAYLYQVFQSAAETSMVFVRAVTIVGRIASGQAAYGQSYSNPFISLMYDYAFVWYFGRMSAFLSNSIITTSLLLSTSMAADRVFALWKPNTYRLIKHRRHQLIALVSSVSLSFLASAFDCFRNVIVQIPNGSYSVILNYQYIGTSKFLAFAALICTLQVIGLLALIILSVLLCLLYRSQYVKPKMGGVNAVGTVEQRRAKRSEKTLTLLTLMECVFKAVGTSFPVLMYITQYAMPQTYACVSALLTVLLDMIMMLVDLCAFFAVIGVSKGVRQLIRRAIPCAVCGQGPTYSSSVTPFNSSKN